MKLLLVSLLFTLSVSLFADNFKLSTSVEKDTSTFNALLSVYKEIFKRLGNHTVTLETLPAERALLSANSGDYDGDSSRIKGMVKSYPNLIEVPTPITKIDVSVYTVNPKITSITPKNAKNYSMVYVRGTKAAEALLKMFNPDTISVTYTNESALKMLIAGRSDIYIQTGRLADDQIKKDGLKEIIKLPIPIYESSAHLILNKKHAMLIPAIDKVIQDMEKDGTLAKLINPTK